MVNALAARGVRCTVLLYNRHGVDPAAAVAVIRRHWPGLKADIGFVDEEISGYDMCVASSWETAHVLARRSVGPMHRFYFVQDYEPYFYPRGSLYSLAEDSYRFGFTHIALGPMVAAEIRRHTAAEALVVPFGCDATTYARHEGGTRDGVAVFARRDAERRGAVLAGLALLEVHRRRPDVILRTFGGPDPGWEVPHEHVGVLQPAELNNLYNRSSAGLVLSFTNVSLVPGEMLRAGLIPVVNDDPLVRPCLDDPRVKWARPTPIGLADAICQAIDHAAGQAGPAAAEAAREVTWATTEEAVAELMLHRVRGPHNRRRSESGEQRCRI
ncbi:glycosyltransferase family 1 protein [Sinomonas atrocyanea]|uniref:glycosyltransferase family 1 protein n=1 Tax=Sinomonas atrocyanea TaxID=37927 RepID=UPI003D99EC67